MSHKYSCFAWWWVHSRPKHVEKRNKHTKKNCVLSWLYLQEDCILFVQSNSILCTHCWWAWSSCMPAIVKILPFLCRKDCWKYRNYVIDGRVNYEILCVMLEVTGRRGRRRRKLLDDLKERRGYSHLKEEALDRTMWRARFGRGFGPLVRQTTKWMSKTIVMVHPTGECTESCVYCTYIICILQHHEKFPMSVAAYIGEQLRSYKRKIYSARPSVLHYVAFIFLAK